jgi:hypothetical protein
MLNRLNNEHVTNSQISHTVVEAFGLLRIEARILQCNAAKRAMHVLDDE